MLQGHPGQSLTPAVNWVCVSRLDLGKYTEDNENPTQFNKQHQATTHFVHGVKCGCSVRKLTISQELEVGPAKSLACGLQQKDGVNTSTR